MAIKSKKIRPTQPRTLVSILKDIGLILAAGFFIVLLGILSANGPKPSDQTNAVLEKVTNECNELWADYKPEVKTVKYGKATDYHCTINYKGKRTPVSNVSIGN